MGVPDATQRSGRGGESGGTSRPVDLAERYRHYDLAAEREERWQSGLLRRS